MRSFLLALLTTLWATAPFAASLESLIARMDAAAASNTTDPFHLLVTSKPVSTRTAMPSLRACVDAAAQALIADTSRIERIDCVNARTKHPVHLIETGALNGLR